MELQPDKVFRTELARDLHIAKNSQSRLNKVNFNWNQTKTRSVSNCHLIETIQHALDTHNSRAKLHRFQHELQASETRFQNVINKHVDALIVVNRQGKVCFANPAAGILFNCTVEQLIGQEIFGTLLLERPSCQLDTRVVPTLGQHIDAERIVVQTQVDVVQTNGDRAIAEMRVVEAEWDGDTAFITTLRDITARVRAEEALRESEAELRRKNQELEATLHELKQTQAQLVHSEKMSSLGLLVAGLAHEINNPVNFIHGNLDCARDYINELLELLQLYGHYYPQPEAEIEAKIQEIDLDFLIEDLPELMGSMQMGSERIIEIVQSLRSFSRHDEAEKKASDIHEGIDSTLLILHNRIKPKAGYPGIKICKDYGKLPLVDCHCGQLNQVLMNILSNAIDALEERDAERSPEEIQACPSQIRIRTESIENRAIAIQIADNGKGIPESIRSKLFDPFFTTKPVGKGTGLGLSISYQIVVEKHGGRLRCDSTPEGGTKFTIEIPI
jgi:PAS domain S-box-containing protein